MSDRSRHTVVVTGNNNNTTTTINASIGRIQDPVADLEAMTKFLAAAGGSLAALDLPPAAHGEAVSALDAIAAESADDAPAGARRRERAAALWRILEGAAGNALGTALIGLWHP
jgi:hypothetical protein